MSVVQTAPSPFAALLRRSKFASFDPSIGQVYNTYGGHAHRGNWGLKRPLPNRRRTGFITIRSVDSPEQQTEWNSAEHSARWMRRWEELGKKLEMEEMGSWRAKLGSDSWTIDTEFDRVGREGLELSLEQEKEYQSMNARNAVPNPDAMNPKQFQKYIDHLRTLRPEFKSFLKETWEDKKRRNVRRPILASEVTTLKFTGSGEVDMFLSAQNPETFVTEFLQRQAQRNYYSPKSKRIEQYPHKLAGLEYTKMSALQSQYLHKPAPGRDLGQNRASRYDKSRETQKFDLIAVGGIIGRLHGQVGGQAIIPTDFGTRDNPRTDKERGKGIFRMSDVSLHDAPVTVDRLPQSVNKAKFRDIVFRMVQTASHSNPFPLGSAEYVAHEGITAGKGNRPIPQKFANLTRHVRMEGIETKQGVRLISKLENMVAKTRT